MVAAFLYREIIYYSNLVRHILGIIENLVSLLFGTLQFASVYILKLNKGQGDKEALENQMITLLYYFLELEKLSSGKSVFTKVNFTYLSLQ